MNPAGRIWSLSLLLCLVFAIVVSITAAEGGGGLMLLIFFIVAIASLVSLVGFYLLFEMLKLLPTSRWIYWISAILLVSIIVLINAWLLILVIDSNFRFDDNGDVREVLAFASIPLATTILSMLASYKQINKFLTFESES